MPDTFITKIHINKVRHLTDLDITLSDTERKHLVLTGKNGSGKTSLLEAIRDFVLVRQQRNIPPQADMPLRSAFSQVLYNPGLPMAGDVSNITVDFSDNADNLFDVMFAYLSVKRNEMTVPSAVEAIDVWGKTIITRNASKDFLRYMLNLYVQYLSAKDMGRPLSEIERYKSWFDGFTRALRDIYDCPALEIKPDMKNLSFLVLLPGREPFGLYQMSDGYKALLEILMELLMRFENGDGTVDYRKSAIVIIDEIETHLHVELQKRALLFLTQMFPCVQFIVTTHSPFVITSLSNAVVYDLEKRAYLENPSYFSYEAIVETFLDANMYSEVMRRQLDRYKALCFKHRTAAENEEFLRIKTTLELMSPASKELYVAFLELEQKRKEVRYGQDN